jgi:hypothetical protein
MTPTPIPSAEEAARMFVAFLACVFAVVLAVFLVALEMDSPGLIATAVGDFWN